MKIKKRLRTAGEIEGLIPPKEKNFYRDHIDVILREDYISSDSDEEELASKIKTARLNTASRQAGSRQGTVGARSAGSRLEMTGGSAGNSADSGVKLPAISTKV